MDLHPEESIRAFTYAVKEKFPIRQVPSSSYVNDNALPMPVNGEIR